MSKSKNKNIQTGDNTRVNNMPDDVIDQPQSEEPQDIPEAKPASSEKSGKGGFAAAIAILFSLSALAASGYLFLAQNSRTQQDSAAISKLESSLSALGGELQSTRQQMQKATADQTAETQSIKKSITRLFTRVENTQLTWSVEEVSQLLQLAVDQLTLAGNIDGALMALSIADRRIADSGDPELQPVREQIAKDIASLQQVARIDLAGTVHRLSTLEQSIDQLPAVSQPAMPAESEPGTAAVDKPATIWQQLTQDMSSLVKIRRIDQPESPLLPPEQNFFLRENSKALVTKASIALMRSDRTIYRNSLQQLAQVITQYFDNSSQKTRWALDEIAALAALDPAPALPDISGSLKSLHNIDQGSQP